MKKVVGIDRKIKRAWLDATLDRMARTTSPGELREFVDAQLQDELPGNASRKKSVGIVLRIWSGIPKERLPLRDRAVAMLPSLNGVDRLWFHWGMTCLAYPFFRDTSAVVGRLLALQDDFTTAQVQSRLLSSWGDRPSIKQAAQKIVATLVDWEVLQSASTKGKFLVSKKLNSTSESLQLWLLEAMLGASDSEEIEANQLLRLPELFPFSLSVGVAELRRSDSFEVHREGLDVDKVALRVAKVEEESKPKTKPKKRPRKTKQTTDSQPTLFDQETEDAHTNKGQPVSEKTAEPTPAATSEIDRDAERKQIEASIKEEVLSTLSERAERFIEARGRQIIPEAPFAAATAECVKQFRDGHFYGCIALTQGVIEAVIRHVWQTKLKKKSTQEGNFEKNLESLNHKGVLSGGWKSRLDQMWKERHTYHHLRRSLEQDQRQLEETARSNLQLLRELEEEFYGYDIRDGFIVPRHPEYWDIIEGEVLVFAREQE